MFDNGTWCERQWPSVFSPSTSFGPVQPFGERNTITGQRGRPVALPVARFALNAMNLVERLVENVAAIRRCIVRGSEPST